MHELLIGKKPAYEASLDHLQKELSSLRTGRATPALVEDIPVSAYDSTMEVKGLASISVLDSKTLLIDAWDKALMPAIEKGIRDANVGLSPIPDGDKIRIVMPMMTEDNRKQMVKTMKEKVEESRISIRSVREGLREDIMEKEKQKELSEDEKFKMLDELDNLTSEYNEKISDIGSNKEQEIMTV
jgi:ribosome recycling factor